MTKITADGKYIIAKAEIMSKTNDITGLIQLREYVLEYANLPLQTFNTVLKHINKCICTVLYA